MKNSYQIIPSQLFLNSEKHGINTLLFFMLLHVQLPFSSAQQSADHYANMHFSPSMAIIIVVLFSALFFMGFFAIYIRHCSNSSGGLSVRPFSRRAVAGGLDQGVLATFPTFVYSEVKQLKIGKGALECAVCLNEFEDNETLRLIPKCDHVFHLECIDAWLESHTTCPVCRANLVPQPGESVHQPGEPHTELDLEGQNDVAAGEEPRQDVSGNEETQPPEHQVINVNGTNQTLNRNRSCRSRSRRPQRFPRSHSTGHSLVQPGENTERFTLRLPVDVRKQIMNRELKRSNSLLVLPRESSSRRGYRGGGEGSSRGRNIRWLDRFGSFKSELWMFSKTSPFFSRASSLISPRVAASDANETPVQPASSSSKPNQLPV